MRLKFIYILLLVLMFPCLAPGKPVTWVSYGEGMAQAQAQGKPVFLHFFADWCGYCQQMERETFGKADVASYLNEHFVSIKVNTDYQQELAGKYQVRGLPDNRFLGTDGVLACRVPGFLDPIAFSFFMEYVRSSAYKTMDPMSYYKSRKAK